MYYGHRGVHPAVAVTLTEGYGVRKGASVVEASGDPMIDELDQILNEGQIDEGLMDILKAAKGFFGNVWQGIKNKIGRWTGGNPDFAKQFGKTYIQDPKKAIQALTQALKAQGTDPNLIPKMVQNA